MAASTVMLYFVLIFLVLCGGNVETVGVKRKDTLKELLQTKGLSVLHQNIRGLLTNFCSIQDLLSSYQSIDILTLSETHITQSENIDKLYEVSGFNFEKRNRVTGRGGGVAVYISHGINYIRRTDLENNKLENIVIEMKTTNLKILLSKLSSTTHKMFS